MVWHRHTHACEERETDVKAEDENCLWCRSCCCPGKGKTLSSHTNTCFIRSKADFRVYALFVLPEERREERRTCGSCFRTHAHTRRRWANSGDEQEGREGEDSSRIGLHRGFEEDDERMVHLHANLVYAIRSSHPLLSLPGFERACTLETDCVCGWVRVSKLLRLNHFLGPSVTRRTSPTIRSQSSSLPASLSTPPPFLFRE